MSPAKWIDSTVTISTRARHVEARSTMIIRIFERYGFELWSTQPVSGARQMLRFRRPANELSDDEIDACLTTLREELIQAVAAVADIDIVSEST